MRSNDQKVVVVTGGAKNIGKGIALKFLEIGWRVGIIDYDKQPLENFPIKDQEKVFLYHGDTSDEYSVSEFYILLKERFERLDAIVNNAAIGGFKNFLDLSVSEWKRVIDVNLTGYFLMARFGVPLILETAGRGAIVNISSTRALMSEPGNEAYSASKAGILGLTHALANSLGPKIRVNAICPGWILHEGEVISEKEHAQHLTGRAGTISDIAEIVLFLVDEEKSGFITGQYFVVDGGMTKKMIYI
ncbi:SDR family oxidoreductase [Fervidobacterium pennivorans]|uniref:SDR family oxidoreductase n=1 Tax=Fervidobacterium pennivorans TaxID=93466 RepID=UPI001436B8B2|nr:SDR family oxidoreductase [Fervidobacterium pennivorans]QIV77946.1 SDR family oxidoreductase [Fervidobacterium pennivorans subsp. keratinolyticus]